MLLRFRSQRLHAQNSQLSWRQEPLGLLLFQMDRVVREVSPEGRRNVQRAGVRADEAQDDSAPPGACLGEVPGVHVSRGGRQRICGLGCGCMCGRGPDCEARLKTEAAQQQLLTWCVRGATAWYASTDQMFDDKVEAVRQCEGDYIDETDHLQRFLNDNTEPAAHEYITEPDLTARLRLIPDKITSVATKMASKGYPRGQRRIVGRVCKIFTGLKWTDEGAA